MWRARGGNLRGRVGGGGVGVSRSRYVHAMAWMLSRCWNFGGGEKWMACATLGGEKQ